MPLTGLLRAAEFSAAHVPALSSRAMPEPNKSLHQESPGSAPGYVNSEMISALKSDTNCRSICTNSDFGSRERSQNLA
jgi:hypothetical protein